MPSLRARVLNAAIRWKIRRLDWGDEARLAARARRVFGLPPWARRLWSSGVTVDLVDAPIAGEWVKPPSPRRGALLFFHGGGYVAGSAADHRAMTAGLARRTGLAVFAPEYRLAPEHRFPAASDDALAAYRWVLDQACEAAEVVVAGDSAGGGLALATLVAARDQGWPLPACALLFSPWVDLSASSASVRTMDGRCHMFRSPNIAAFASAYLGTNDPRDPRASPLNAELQGLPPLLIQVAETELLVDEARSLHAKALAAGVASRIDVAGDVTHVWQMLDGLVPEATAAMDAAAAFVCAHLDRAHTGVAANSPLSSVSRSAMDPS